VLKIPVNIIYPAYNRYWKDWKLGKTTMHQVYSNFTRDIGSDYPVEKLIDITLNYAKLNKQVANMIIKIKKNYKVVCLTNHAREWFSNEVKRFDLNSLFDKIYTSYDLKIDKPHEEAYLLVLKDLNLQPEETVFIDDLQRNTEVASSLGMHTVHFKSYSQLKKELRKEGIKI
jgi:epoxide hydrolase-like predicted phosphatase